MSEVINLVTSHQETHFFGSVPTPARLRETSHTFSLNFYDNPEIVYAHYINKEIETQREREGQNDLLESHSKKSHSRARS